MRKALSTTLTCLSFLATAAGSLPGQAPGGADSTRALATLARVEQAAKPDTGARALQRVVMADRLDIGSAFNWLVSAGRAEEAARFVAAAGTFFPAHDARDWYEGVLAMPAVQSSPKMRMPLLVAASRVAFHLGDQQSTRKWAQDLLEIAQAAGDRTRAGSGYFRLSQVALRDGNLTEFHRINDAMLAFCREKQDERCELNVRNMRGEAARVERNYELAAEMNQKNLLWARDHNLGPQLMTAIINLAFIDLARGKTGGVEDTLIAEIERARAASDRETVALMIAGLAMYAYRANDFNTAARLLGAASAERERLGTLPDPADQVQIAETMKAVRKQLGQKTFARLFAVGRKQKLEDVVAEALR